MASKVNVQMVIGAKNNTKAAFNEVNAQLEGMDKRISSAAFAIKGLLGVSALKGAAIQYANLADQSKQIDARLQQATKSQEEFNKASSEVRRIADENGASLGAVAQLYSRLSPALREAGRSQGDVVKVTEAVTKALKISGASAAESEGAITQFAQALGAGALRGDEFNSIAEAAPRLMQALADSLNVPVGALREMAKAGQLTSDVVSTALIEQLPKLAEEAEAFGDTFGSASQRLQNAAVDMVGAFDKLTGASARATDSMNKAAEALNGISSGEKAVQNISKLLTEIAKLTPQGAILFSGFDAGLDALGLKTEKALNETLAAKEKYQLQLDLFEKQETDGTIRRLAAEEKAAAEIAGVKYDEVQSLKGWAKQMGTTYEDFIRREQERHDLRVAAEATVQGLVNDARKAGLADLQKDIDAKTKLLESENKRLAKARESTLNIEREFNLLSQDIRSGRAGSESTFGDVQSLKVAARQALQAGDNKLAIEQARRAGEALKQLADSGENTYGLAGIADELGRIAVEASKLEEVNVENDVKAVAAQINDLTKQAEALKVVSISVQIDETNVEQVKARMMDIAADIAKAMIIKPTIVAPGVQSEPTEQFATGGRVRGPGTGTSDSILARLSNGEYVLRAAAVRQYGTALLDRMNGLQLPKYAEGGLVETAMSLPGVNANPLKDWGRATLESGGSSIEVLMKRDSFDQVLSRTAKKFGGTRRN